MSRHDILAELIARLELERFTPTPRQQRSAEGDSREWVPDPLPDWTAGEQEQHRDTWVPDHPLPEWTTDEQEQHRDTLNAAVGGDPVGNVAAFRDDGMVKRRRAS